MNESLQSLCVNAVVLSGLAIIFVWVAITAVFLFKTVQLVNRASNDFVAVAPKPKSDFADELPYLKTLPPPPPPPPPSIDRKPATSDSLEKTPATVSPSETVVQCHKCRAEIKTPPVKSLVIDRGAFLVFNCAACGAEAWLPLMDEPSQPGEVPQASQVP